MATLAPTEIRAATGWTARHPLQACALLFLALSLLLRSAWFGNPLAGYDEQFYLLTGSRLLDGAIPYVDIWDRKPLGLFLIYAAASRFGDGVLAYQLVAAACVALTGLTIAAQVLRRFSVATAMACGSLYILWTGVMGGEDGQSPLFYNLLVATAALLVVRAVPRIATRRGFTEASGAMALCGLALTVKTTVIFEACFFGATLALSMLRGRGLRLAVPAALLWMLLGALPFLAIAASYAQCGQFDAFWFANATSAALRHDGFELKSVWHLALTLAPLGPLLLLGAAGRAHADQPEPTPPWERHFLLGWLIAATIGFSAVGYFFHHYALPLLVPLTICAARFLAFSPHRRLALILFAIYPATQQLAINRWLAKDDRTDAAAIVQAIPSGVRDDCMLIYGGPPILYHLTNACLVTRFAFPDHLYVPGEAPAIGVDQAQAVRDAIARRPAVIVTDLDAFPERRSPASDALVTAALRRDYRLAAVRPWRFYETGKHRLAIWKRRDWLGNSKALPISVRGQPGGSQSLS